MQADDKAYSIKLGLADGIITGSEVVAIKKLSNNDRDWAGNEKKHQNGVYVSGVLQTSDFFPPLVQRTDIPHIYEQLIRTYWPALDIWKESRLVHYSNKGREYHMTRIPEPEFIGLSPASLLLFGKCRDDQGEFWQCMTVDSTSDACDYLNDIYELKSDFIDGVFKPVLEEEEVDYDERLIAELLDALAKGKLPELCAAYQKIPATGSLAIEAQAEYQRIHGNTDFDPFQMESPGDAVRAISRDIEFMLFKNYERRLRTAKTLSILFPDNTHVDISMVVSGVVRGFPDLYKNFLGASQQRKSRAGKSFEHHIRRLLIDGKVPFSEQAVIGKEKPDFILPSKELFVKAGKGQKDTLVLSAKTTLRERWKQVIKEIRDCDLYLATVDENIASDSIVDMATVGVNLVVPESLKHSEFTDYAKHGNVLSFRDFFRTELAKNRRPVWGAIGVVF